MFSLPFCAVPKHAAPREPLSLETRSVLAVGLAAAMLPLGAAPALAEGTSNQTSATSAGAEAPAAAAPATRKAATSLSLRAPSAARTAKVQVGITLLSDGKGVRDGFVRLEKSTGKGWTYVGRLLTDDNGVGKGTLTLRTGTKLRAAYTGSQVRTAAVSPARIVRGKTALAAPAPAAAPARAEQGLDGVLAEAATHLGKPYRFGSVGPDSFDCSGFTRYVYAQATGKSLPHNSRAQEAAATPVSRDEARPGDLVFVQDVAGHVGIYAGNNKMYDAPRSGKNVSLRTIWTSNVTFGRV